MEICKSNASTFSSYELLSYLVQLKEEYETTLTDKTLKNIERTVAITSDYEHTRNTKALIVELSALRANIRKDANITW